MHPGRFLVPMAAIVLAGCDAPTASRSPARIEIVSGNLQQGQAGEPLPDPLVVRVTDRGGSPLANQVVDFRVLSGDGAVLYGAALTNGSGIAREHWTLGGTAGDGQRVEARVLHARDGTVLISTMFGARALPQAAAALEGGGETAAGLAGTPLREPVQVRVVDRFGNPVPGARVAWSVAVGGGSVAPAESLTDDAGVARTSWTRGHLLGTRQVLVATLGSSTAQWTTVATPPFTAELELVSGDLRGGLPGQRVAFPVRVRLREQYAGPVPGAWIRVTGPDGVTTADSALTDGQGYALLRPVLGTSVGTQDLEVYLLGSTARTFIHGYAHPEEPTLELLGPVTVGNKRTIRVRVASAAGVPLSGYPVHATRDSVGRSVITMFRADPQGVVEFQWDVSELLLMEAGPARLTVNARYDYPWIDAGLFPNVEITPATPFPAWAYAPPEVTLWPAPKHFQGGIIRTGVYAIVHGRRIGFHYERALASGEHLWRPPGPSWLEGLPEGPTVVRLELWTTELTWTPVPRLYRTAELPVIIRHGP